MKLTGKYVHQSDPANTLHSTKQKKPASVPIATRLGYNNTLL
jgi:hypothetical protein